MKIPNKLKVGGHEYKVEITKTYDEKKEHNNWGQTNHVKLKIYLDEGLANTKMEETFIHELLHAVDSHQGNILKEGQVDKIANTLYAVLKDNNLLK